MCVPLGRRRPPDCSNENSRICSCHFVGGMKSAAPSVFTWSEKKLSCFTASHTDLKVCSCINTRHTSHTEFHWIHNDIAYISLSLSIFPSLSLSLHTLQEEPEEKDIVSEAPGSAASLSPAGVYFTLLTPPGPVCVRTVMEVQ